MKDWEKAAACAERDTRIMALAGTTELRNLETIQKNTNGEMLRRKSALPQRPPSCQGERPCGVEDFAYAVRLSTGART